MISSRFVSILLVSILCLGAFAQDAKPRSDGAAPAKGLVVSVPAFTNATCPIMGGKAKADLFVETDHGRIYMCCKGCTKKIQADPEAAYKKAYPKATVVGNKSCPVTGVPIESGSPSITLQGYEVRLGSKEAVKEAQQSSQAVLAKVLNPKAKVVGNKTCPVTGTTVDRNCVVLIGDHLVNLSSPAAIEEVRKAPQQMLDKALGKPGTETPPAKTDGKKPDEPKKPGHEGHGHDGCHD